MPKLLQAISDLLKSAINFVGAKLDYSTQQTNIQTANNYMAIMNQNIVYQQLQLQNALFQVFKGMTAFTQLNRLNVPLDLLPYGAQPVNGIMTYYFEWAKTSNSIIAQSTLYMYRQQMDTAIQSYCAMSNMILQQLNCNVIHILNCQDNGMSIILEVQLY